ncbi:putative Cytochrome P450 [Seiridium cardinale]
MLSELLSHPALLVSAIFLVYSIVFLLKRPEIPEIPILGARKGDWFPLLEARWRNARDFKTALERAYMQHGPVLVPVAEEGNIVIVPFAEVKFITDQPESILSFDERANDFVQIEHTFMDLRIASVALQGSFLRTQRTRQIVSLVPVLAEEVVWALEKYWRVTDTDDEDAMRSASSKRFATSYDEQQKNPGGKTPSFEPEPNDVLQWSIKQGKDSGDPYMWRSKTLADRILTINFASIHSTSFTMTEVILDLVSSKAEYIDEIRDEVSSVLAAHGRKWNKNALNQLEKLDSAIRESARLSSVLSTGLARTVVAENGVTTPSGVHLPQGTKVNVAARCIMRDEAMWTESETFMPFRFYDQRNGEFRMTSGTDGYKEDLVRRARNALPTTKPDFLTFGHGIRACPGRFFATALLKLMVAEALLGYEFEILTNKPKDSWFGVTRVPPLKAFIKIRKRREL